MGRKLGFDRYPLRCDAIQLSAQGDVPLRVSTHPAVVATGKQSYGRSFIRLKRPEVEGWKPVFQTIHSFCSWVRKNWGKEAPTLLVQRLDWCVDDSEGCFTVHSLLPSLAPCHGYFEEDGSLAYIRRGDIATRQITVYDSGYHYGLPDGSGKIFRVEVRFGRQLLLSEGFNFPLPSVRRLVRALVHLEEVAQYSIHQLVRVGRIPKIALKRVEESVQSITKRQMRMLGMRAADSADDLLFETVLKVMRKSGDHSEPPPDPDTAKEAV